VAEVERSSCVTWYLLRDVADTSKEQDSSLYKIGGVMFYDAEDINRMIQKRKQNLDE